MTPPAIYTTAMATNHIMKSSESKKPSNTRKWMAGKMPVRPRTMNKPGRKQTCIWYPCTWKCRHFDEILFTCCTGNAIQLKCHLDIFAPACTGTSDADSYDNFAKMEIFAFRCMLCILSLNHLSACTSEDQLHTTHIRVIHCTGNV